jgi:amino acid transporter
MVKAFPNVAAGRLGTFAGVFTPSVLTILGLILFRRLGFVVGGAGLGQALVILLVAHAISILTSTSLSAIATNLRVKGGGDYYLISRSLGVEFGGALGVVLFLAQSISVAFYCIGFGEALAVLMPEGALGARAIAAAAVLFLFVFAWLGADWATRLQYLVMAALGLALASFFLGGLPDFSWERVGENWTPSPEVGLGFGVLFALFFPAVTGFTQGVSMSGDLADPGRSLPTGTFAAVFLSMVVYLAAALLFAGALPSAELVGDYEAMGRVAHAPALITIGIVAATLSSALASFLGAPRILQALAADRIFPPLRPFAAGHGPAGNPRRGVLATLGIALVFIAMGGVDFIAPIVSMFFLISYGLLNYATALEARAKSPSFRPRFRWFHYRTSLLGAAACLGVMLLINPLASAVAIGLLFVLYQYVERLGGPDRWAAGRRDHYFANVRRNLRAMAGEPVHPRNWRPHLLVFSDTDRRREGLVRFASWLEGGSGMTTVVRLLEGGGDELIKRCREEQKVLSADLVERGLEAYALVVAAPNPEVAAQTVIQSHGLGPVRTNTIVLNWLDFPEPEEDDEGSAADGGARAAAGGTEDAEQAMDAEPTEGERSLGEGAVDPDLLERIFVKQLRSAARLGVNAIVLDAGQDDLARVQGRPSAERRIDVWWTEDPTGRLALLLAHMVTRSDEWSGATIRLLVRSDGRSREKLTATLSQALEEVRIEAQVDVVEKPTAGKLIERARDASLLFLPLRMRRWRAVDPFGKPIDELLEQMPMTALVAAVEDIPLGAEPEEGELGRLAAMSDALKDAERAARKAASLVERAHKASEEARAAADKTRLVLDESEVEGEQREKARGKLDAADEALKAAEKDLLKAEREAAAAHRKAETARKRLIEAGGQPPPAKGKDARDGEDPETNGELPAGRRPGTAGPDETKAPATDKPPPKSGKSPSG